VRSTILLFLCSLVAFAASAREFDVRPVPAWVDRADADTTLSVAKSNVRWGIYDILEDHQVRVADRTTSHFHRTVRKVLSPSGVQNASELSLDFDPSYERLTLHAITIVRDGKRVDALEPDAVRVVDKEEDADEDIYDGERSALVFLKDVRPGDVIDYAWSIDGDNPLLDGRYADSYDLSSAVPTRRVRCRLLFPANRPLFWRGTRPRITPYGAEQELVWERANVHALDVEDAIPSWYEPWDLVQVTDFASWNDVARWSDAMFQLDARSRDAVRALAARLTRENPNRDARITAAIRFVQDDVRYLGIEFGRNSHEPHQPSETLDQRYGDCKDKTFLLVALLRELGLEAYPALVNTRLRERLADRLPSPFLFDHVITQVIDGGRTYWVDGTIADQGGTLRTLETPNDRRALVVRPETRALANIVTNEQGSTVVEQTYTTTDYAKPTLLDVKTTYTGADADDMRASLARMSVEDFAHDRINDLAADQPKIASAGAPKIDDDRLRDVIVVNEHYRIPDLWNDGNWTWYPRVLDAHFDRPDTMIRSMPLAFDYPLDVRQTVTFHLPERIDIEKTKSVTETPTFRYESVVDSDGRSVWLRKSLRARRDYVDVHDVPEHLTQINAIWDSLGYRLSPDGARVQREQPVAAASAAASPLKWGVGLLIVALVFGASGLFATRSKRRATAVVPRVGFRPGEAPAVAVAVADRTGIDAHLAGLACTCGTRAWSVPELQRARYGERDMTIVTRQCAMCGREQNVYFTAG